MPKSLKKTSAVPPAPTLVNGRVLLHGRNLKLLKRRSGKPPPPAIPPRRTSNLDRRTREYLTPTEVEKLLQAAGNFGHHRSRQDAYFSRIPVQLRVSELVTMRWEEIAFNADSMHFNRLKNNLGSTHPIRDI